MVIELFVLFHGHICILKDLDLIAYPRGQIIYLLVGVEPLVNQYNITIVLLVTDDTTYRLVKGTSCLLTIPLMP